MEPQELQANLPCTFLSPAEQGARDRCRGAARWTREGTFSGRTGVYTQITKAIENRNSEIGGSREAYAQKNRNFLKTFGCLERVYLGEKCFSKALVIFVFLEQDLWAFGECQHVMKSLPVSARKLDIAHLIWVINMHVLRRQLDSRN